MASKITVVHDPRVSALQLIEAIEPTGMSAHLPQKSEQAAHTAVAGQRRKWTVGLSGALTGLGLVLQWMDAAPEWLRIAIFVFAIVSGGWFIFPKGVAALRRLSPA